MIISFSKTIKLASELNRDEPMKAGIKTVTRRLWKPKVHDSVVKAFERGQRTHQAWTNCSFVKNAHCMGFIELTQAPYLEKLEDMPEIDIYHEGNLWSNKEEFIKVIGCNPETILSVVRFKFQSK